MTARNEARPRVVAIVANVKQFRRAFYTLLHARLAEAGVDFEVLYSAPSREEAGKGDSIDLPPPIGRRVPRLYALGDRALLQLPPLAIIARADLVIVVQATGYLLNYPMLALARLGLKRVAFWGHGWNRQGARDSSSERLKRRLATWPQWWFAYTTRTRTYLESVGMDPARISTIDNAIDTRGFAKTLESFTADELAAARVRFGLADDDVVGLYCGSLYAEKRVPMLLEAATRIAREVPRFRLLVVGAGREASLVEAAARQHDFIRYAGPLFGRDKAATFRLARVFLNPGLVGLGILDSFAARLPLVTTKDALHSPEIDYLEHDINGVMTEGTAEAFASAVVDLLRSPERVARIADAAGRAAERYTVENMVANVERGILRCLGHGAENASTEGA